MMTVVKPLAFSKLPIRRVVLPSLVHQPSFKNMNNQIQFFHSTNNQFLPKLPVPPLNQTIEKYLKTVKPLVNDESFKKTCKIAEDFKMPGGKGEQLQKALEERAKSKDNWLSEWWLEYAYLRARSPIAIHYSPSVSFPKYEFHGVEGQLRQAAKLVSAVLSYKVNIDSRSIPVERMGKDELCMEQYYNLLSTCRVPGSPMDQIKYYGKESPPGHVTVVHNNQFFELKCYRNDGKVLTIGELESQLARIVQASPEPETPVGILTTADRDSWARDYSKLRATNPASLDSIESSIFLLCLDGMPDLIEEPSAWRSDFALRCLHGGGSAKQSGNRWFDKTVQLIVDQNGGVGLAYEHSPAEGPPVAAMLDYIYSYFENLPNERKGMVYDLPLPTKLDFCADEEIKKSIADASNQLDQLISRLHLCVCKFDDFGKNLIKTHKVSPDSFIQIAMQLAFYRLHKSAPATYESASLRKFALGRTDTIRSCSIVSDMFVKAMTEGGQGKTKLRQMMMDAINEHRSYVMAAVNGNGIDRHLLGMKLVALENGENVPSIFTDPVYERAMQFNLSTSQVSCKADLCMAFGPALDQGYGICYNPKSDKLLFSVSTYDDPEYEAKRFGAELMESMRIMRQLLESTATSKL